MNSETVSTAGGFVRADDRQVSGQHYKEMTVQPWTAMEVLLSREEFIGFLKGNIIKYGMRQGRKDGSDDGNKCLHYIQKLDEVVNGAVRAEQARAAEIREMQNRADAELRSMQNRMEGWCNGK